MSNVTEIGVICAVCKRLIRRGSGEMYREVRTPEGMKPVHLSCFETPIVPLPRTEAHTAISAVVFDLRDRLAKSMKINTTVGPEPPQKKYVLHPGIVRSSDDNDVHYVDAHQLAQLYGVPYNECYVFRETERMPNGAWSLLHLHPDPTGKYQIPEE